ncbi:MAG: sulfatase [Verrucomicrobiota bacterium]
MKVIMLMFDSLNRHMLPSYGCDWTHAPNFKRLAERSVQFNKSYVCSMPCMPARRDFQTGRPHFLHHSWGPLEPYDDSFVEMLAKEGVSSHLITDHYHYWEDGGSTYHNRYSTYQFIRGQEGDLWKGQVTDPDVPENINKKGRRQDWVNRKFINDEEDFPQRQTLACAKDFIDRNHQEDQWFLQIETFDPHEPFFSHEKYKKHYPHDYEGPLFDWPGYQPVEETDEQIEHLRMEYASLLSMCDATLGEVLDQMDQYSMWDDTMLIIWTDHGFLLGEHNCLAKNWTPLFEEISHTPFFIWDPRSGNQGEVREALVQPAIDLAPTILDFFGQDPTSDMLGKNLKGVIERDEKVRDAAIFGYHSHRVNVTDGRYVYYREQSAGSHPVYNYSMMPNMMRGFVCLDQLKGIEMHPPLSFTKGCPIPRYLSRVISAESNTTPFRETLLFDLDQDAQQQSPLKDLQIEEKMIDHMFQLMRECDAPKEEFRRMGLVCEK